MWRIGKGWTLEDGEKPAVWGLISFPLIEARQKYGESELLKSEFHVNQEITCALGKKYRLNAKYTVKVFDGRSMVASPLESIQPVIFDFSNFSWHMPELQFYRAKISVIQRLGQASSLTIQRNAVPGRELLYLPVLIDPMQEIDVGVVSAQVLFAAREGKKAVALKWNLNKENLVELFPALFVSIFKGDWTK